MSDLDAQVRRYLESLTHLHAVPDDRSDICRICCGPTGTRDSGRYRRCPRCSQMAKQAHRAGAELADHTSFVVYALQTKSKGSDQALRDMYTYKGPQRTTKRIHDAESRVATLIFSALRTAYRRNRIGGPFDVVTCVPSSAHGNESPLSLVIEKVLRNLDVLLFCTPTLEWTPRRPQAKHQLDLFRFYVPDKHLVEGQRVLLIEDTWVSGGNAQSAAAALKTAGVEHVTILTVARMLDETGKHSGYLVDRYPRLPRPTLDD